MTPQPTPLTRRNFLQGLTAGAVGVTLGGRFLTGRALAEAVAGSDGSAAGRPNILFILADQWRASAMGYAGDPNVKTPNLDRLAAESLNFQNVVSVCPVCTPYRGALLTGRFPTSTGMFLNDLHLPTEEYTLAEAFKEGGYQTGYIGKWHLDGHGRHVFIPPERRQGWDYWKVAECDHNYRRSHYYANESPEKKFWDGYDAYDQTRDAQEYLREHADKDRQPFFLTVSYGGPHFPHETAPDDLKALYPPDKIQLPANVPPAMRKVARKEAQGYYAHCTAIDQCVGELLITLAETGLDKDTIVIFTSDHGETMGSHGVAPKMKQVPWDEAALVPFLMRAPSIQNGAGRSVKTPVTTPDLFPTLAGLAGLPIPKSVEGEDLSASLRDGKDLTDRAALYMSPAPFSIHPPEFRKEYRALRTAQFTYVRGLEGPWLLYDHKKDPLQMDNLLENPEFAETVKDLDARLSAELARIDDDFRPAQSYIDEWGYTIKPSGNVETDAEAWPPQIPTRRKTSARIHSQPAAIIS